MQWKVRSCNSLMLLEVDQPVPMYVWGKSRWLFLIQQFSLSLSLALECTLMWCDQYPKIVQELRKSILKNIHQKYVTIYSTYNCSRLIYKGPAIHDTTSRIRISFWRMYSDKCMQICHISNLVQADEQQRQQSFSNTRFSNRKQLVAYRVHGPNRVFTVLWLILMHDNPRSCSLSRKSLFNVTS
jgi:hypothetical protein